jgi:hypothetical protein
MNINETPRQRFKRLAEKRTKAILDKIRVLSNLSNRTNYEYDEADVNKIFRTLEEELRIARAQFKLPKKREFKL